MNHNFAARHKRASQAKHKYYISCHLLVLNFRVYTLWVATVEYFMQTQTNTACGKIRSAIQIVDVETCILQLASYKLTRADIAIQCEF